MKYFEVLQSQICSKYVGDLFFKKLSDSKYIINSDCICSHSKIIRIGQIYLLYGIQLPGRRSDMALIQVLSVYLHKGINILMLDIGTKTKHNLIFDQPKEAPCNLKIIDVKYFNENLKKWKNQS